MKRKSISALMIASVCAIITSAAVSGADKIMSVPLTKSDVIEWDSSLKLPDGNIGLAGAFSGYCGNSLVVGGGANFPDGTPAEGGIKKFYSDTYLYDGTSWTTVRNCLPEALAYGVSIQLENGILMIGGCNLDHCSDEVGLLSVQDGKVKFSRWPSLPVPLSNAAGCKVGGKVYVAGGIESVSDQKATKDFFVLDLNAKDKGWQSLGAWPGPARAFAVACAQSDGYDDCLYLFSGRDFQGQGPWNVLSDGYCYNPRLDRWTPLEGKFDVMAGTALPFGTNHILLLGGRDSTNADEHMVWLYHTVTRTLIKSSLPSSLVMPVTTNAFLDRKGEIVIASGETAPGVRTPVIMVGTVHSNIHHLNFWDYFVIVFYFALLLFIGWFFSRKQKTSEDYFKGGGRIPWFIAGLSIFGTALSAITFMSMPAKAYATDWSYMFYNAGIILVVPIIVLLFIPLYRKLNVTTAYEYLEVRFNAFVRVLCSICYILFQIGRMGVILLLPAIALNVVTGVNIFMCVGVMGIMSLIYTMMGGVEAVAWTDALQVVVLIGAALTVLIIVCVQLPGGLGNAIAVTSEAGKFNLGSTAFDLRQPTLWTVLIATVFTNITTYGTDQTIVQRYLTTKTVKQARKSVYVNAALTIPVTVLFFLVGTAIWAFYHFMPDGLSMSVQNQDAILPWYISTQLPSGVVGLVIAGIFAAAMSTLSGSMNSAATAFVTDIYSKIASSSSQDGAAKLRLARIVTLIIGLVGIAFAFMMATWEIKSLWDEFAKILGILLGGLGGLFLLGFICRRANSFGAICGIIASIVAQIIVLKGGYVNLLLYSTTGFISCFVVGYLASLLVPSRKTAGQKVVRD
jgi:SSS family solute:Na+ symporter